MTAEVQKYTMPRWIAWSWLPVRSTRTSKARFPRWPRTRPARGPRKGLYYRGDVTLTLKSGERIEAYIFNRSTGATLEDSFVQYFLPKSKEKRKVSYAQIARLEFTGKDRAAGKHWEDWVKAWNKEKKAAGEKNFGLHPEALE